MTMNDEESKLIENKLNNKISKHYRMIYAFQSPYHMIWVGNVNQLEGSSIVCLSMIFIGCCEIRSKAKNVQFVSLT